MKKDRFKRWFCKMFHTSYGIPGKSGWYICPKCKYKRESYHLSIGGMR